MMHVKRWLPALIPVAVGLVALKPERRHKVASMVKGRRPLLRDRAEETILALEEANLRERFRVLAPELRLTHAGAGRPREAWGSELEKFIELGLVELVKQPHVAAGMLDVYRLTQHGKHVYERLQKHSRPEAQSTAR